MVNDLGGAMDGTGGSSEAAEAVVAEIKAAGGEAIANGSSVSDRDRREEAWWTMRWAPGAAWTC